MVRELVSMLMVSRRTKADSGMKKMTSRSMTTNAPPMACMAIR